MKEFKKIFSILEKELQKKSDSTLEYYNLWCKSYDENKELKKQIKELKDQMEEANKEIFKFLKQNTHLNFFEYGKE
jgi:oligoribonuclease (3'-5' exoribonuclease)